MKILEAPQNMRTDNSLMIVKMLFNVVDGVILNEGLQHPELWLEKFTRRL